ncbi:hypothetical protein TTHERM_000442079 (macronuclear) [Tetrahymena thermophila SB210]|uniref:Uncharacterized protein n=1 Tax=Tetrahymena thermophila (strain SB210) TaxID=312017 RepID=W7XJA6_TETTS|nr:hypothetical protein TTHERM_000442079 [Tetrahymena thermophila SB210]EWS73994.1 hypothetical protein TTHERM_000442079 [Tetrahymena thermophila SB210]|eukprot:XP_012653456.1 hypothetical protein TTHERM_000442079 [Tetrahymena thermophila SB210]
MKQRVLKMLNKTYIIRMYLVRVLSRDHLPTISLKQFITITIQIMIYIIKTKKIKILMQQLIKKINNKKKRLKNQPKNCIIQLTTIINKQKSRGDIHKKQTYFAIQTKSKMRIQFKKQ